MSTSPFPPTSPSRDNPSPPDGGAEGYREKLADALHTGADKAREWSDRGPDQTAKPMRSTGESLDAMGSYLHTHNLQQIYDDATDWAKRNPGPALAAAASLGLCLGLALQSMQRRPVVIRTRQSAFEE